MTGKHDNKKKVLLVGVHVFTLLIYFLILLFMKEACVDALCSEMLNVNESDSSTQSPVVSLCLYRL